MGLSFACLDVPNKKGTAFHKVSQGAVISIVCLRRRAGGALCAQLIKRKGGQDAFVVIGRASSRDASHFFVYLGESGLDFLAGAFQSFDLGFGIHDKREDVGHIHVFGLTPLASENREKAGQCPAQDI